MVQYFTEEGLQKLKDELHELKTKKTKEIAELLKYAASFGDLKENAGYDDAKERQSWLLRRIAELESIVHTAIIKEKVDENIVQVGSKIKILFVDKPASAKGFGEAREEEYEIVAPGEADVLHNKISYESPLGKELIGKKINSEFSFGPKNIKIKILSVK
jgi:transcription elongation factor GreA